MSRSLPFWDSKALNAPPIATGQNHKVDRPKNTSLESELILQQVKTQFWNLENAIMEAKNWRKNPSYVWAHSCMRADICIKREKNNSPIIISRKGFDIYPRSTVFMWSCNLPCCFSACVRKLRANKPLIIVSISWQRCANHNVLTCL